MYEIQLQCQGLPCPKPVIKCKEAIEDSAPKSISVIVDNEAAKENVSRFLKSHGYEISIQNKENDIIISGNKEVGTDIESEKTNEIINKEENVQKNQKILVFIPSEVIGSGDDELGERLMYNFLITLKEMGNDLWRIVLLNGGVKLSVPENKCMKELQQLEKNGISILVCGTCLEHFGMTGCQGVGEVTNMLDIITSFQLATKTIRV